MASMHVFNAIICTTSPIQMVYLYLNGLELIDLSVALKLCHRLQRLAHIAVPLIINSCGFWVLCHKLHFDVLLSQALMR